MGTERTPRRRRDGVTSRHLRLFAFAASASALPACVDALLGHVAPSPALSPSAIARACSEAAASEPHPFIVDWESARLADFEARAARGTVFVRYDGCAVEILQECGDSHLGTYAPPDAVTPMLEVVDMKTEGELYERLPLGAAQLAVGVRSGNAVRLKYVTSGVATSTRPSIYSADLSGLTGCDGATHFIAAFDVGAFALTTVEGGASSKDGGAGSSSVGEGQLRLGGDFQTCQSEDRGHCQVPLRLTLRKITQGAGPPP